MIYLFIFAEFYTDKMYDLDAKRTNSDIPHKKLSGTELGNFYVDLVKEYPSTMASLT